VIILPRQARDGHKEKHSKRNFAFLSSGLCGIRVGKGEIAMVCTLQRKKAHTYLSRRVMPNLIILPKQARDKHRESSTQKRDAVSCRRRARRLARVQILTRAVAASALSHPPPQHRQGHRDRQHHQSQANAPSSRTLASQMRKETRPFAPFIYKNDRFTKTGSGQT
jgi:hypothetical protein